MDWTCQPLLADTADTNSVITFWQPVGKTFMNILARRWATQDLLLVGLATATLILGLWPTNPPRQMIHIRGVGGNTTSYSFSLDDSRLARLRRELKRRENPGPTPEIVIAKWRLELASHYAKRCSGANQPDNAELSGDFSKEDAPAEFDAEPISPPIAQVSFENPASSELFYWQQLADASSKTLVAAERKLAQRIADQEAPPVTLGDVFVPHKGFEAWVTAILLALLAACLFAEWAYRSPAITIGPVSLGGGSTLASDPNSIRFEIPREWIRVHQSGQVWTRRAALTLLVLAALATYL